MVWVLSAREERRLRAMEAFRQDRRMVDEDVTVFGEQVAELHVDTLTTELDPDMQQDYRTALEAYEAAKGLLGEATTSAEVIVVGEKLNDGRFARACLLARRDGEPMPQRREPCFFNPQHGPARTDIDWAPPGGVERSIGVCLPDALRLEGGERPDMRLVRVGDRWVPWYAATEESNVSKRLGRFNALPLDAQLYATANGIGRDLGLGSPF